MTRKEAMRLTAQSDTLRALGFTGEEAESLRRISMTLRRWHELECGIDGGCIERDEETGRPYWVSEWGAQWTAGKRCRRPIADREAGAKRRLLAIINAHAARAGKALSAYIQTDPRGAALYIIRPGDVPAGEDVSAYYTRGVCVY